MMSRWRRWAQDQKLGITADMVAAARERDRAAGRDGGVFVGAGRPKPIDPMGLPTDPMG